MILSLKANRYIRRIRQLLPVAALLGGILFSRRCTRGITLGRRSECSPNIFYGTDCSGLSLVSIVWGGLMFAFAEGDSKRMLAGILFGVGMAIGAVNFMTWLFP